VIDFNAFPSSPDRGAMEHMVHAMFRTPVRGLVELAWSSPNPPHAIVKARQFDLDSLDEMIDLAKEINATPNQNVYISAGLRDDQTDRFNRASDAEVIAITAIKVDFDTAGSYEAAMAKLSDAGCLPNFVVITGHKPHTRAHAWYILDEPAHDLAAVRQVEERLAKWLGGDTTVVNPSRIMRLAGSVAWPIKAGRTIELTEIEASGLPKAAWNLEHLVRRLPAAPPPKEGLDFNTARSGPLNIETLIEKASASGEWHASVLRAVASMTARGTPDDVILSLLPPLAVQPGFSLNETRQDIETMLRGARQKGFSPEVLADVGANPDTFAGKWLEDIEYVYEPEIVEDIIPGRGVGVIYGPSSSGKSFIAIDWAMRAAVGQKVLDRYTVPAGVLYLAAEGKHGLDKRIHAARQTLQADGHCAPFWRMGDFVNFANPQAGHIDKLKRTAISVSEEMASRGAALRVIIIDTLAASTPGADENAGTDMAPLLQAFHQVSSDLNCVVILIAHTGKDVGKGLRGWSGIRANVDFAIETQVLKDEEGHTVKRQIWFEKCKDGPDGFVLAEFELKTYFLGNKASGAPNTTCWVDYFPPQKGPSAADVRAEIEAREKEQAEALKGEILAALAECLTDQWRPLRETAEVLRHKGGVSLGRDNLVGYLTSLTNDVAEGVTDHWFKGAKIQIQTTPKAGRFFRELRVLKGDINED
jgi:hypothetical protein